MADSFTQEELDEIKVQFDAFDADGNGHITTAEIGSILKALGESVPGYKLRDMIAECDLDKNGTVELTEFQNIYIKVKTGKASYGLHKISEKRKLSDLKVGTSEASAEGASHSFSEAEALAFSDWINSLLREDPDCKALIPIANGQLFEACRDGIILCKLINKSVPYTIDERAINLGRLSSLTRFENLILAISSAEAIGCYAVNIGPEDLDAGRPHLVLGLVWQIIRTGLLSGINVSHRPGLIHLLQEGETLVDLQKLSPEEVLLRWVNYHLRRAEHARRIRNFSADIKDSEVYTHLLKQIAPTESNVDLSPMQESDMAARADSMLNQADKIGCRKFVRSQDVVKGDAKLNLAFVANLFNNYPALEGVNENQEEELYEETREEKTYRNWMNSLGVSPYVNNIYNDLQDGLVLFQLFDKCKPGIVDWDRVNKTFKQLGGRMKKIENCNYAIELGNALGFSLVGIGGEDIYNGTHTLVLALVWQLMRAYTISILSAVTSNSNVADADIINWVNEKVDNNARISNFGDPNISTGTTVLNLVDKIKPASVNWDLVTAAQTDELVAFSSRSSGGVGGTVACESTLRYAGTLLSRVRAQPSGPRSDGGPKKPEIILLWTGYIQKPNSF
ncbi:plastin-2-like [Plakobranchus ocellatus]|uniref:Plastin-2-like n=1 Tax=Plakobranchus ocellatus TaxID=259542 RepID=A0AAV4BGX2_9GAST|nr:plastin-2-like [Plakobranchus ocellatus]